MHVELKDSLEFLFSDSTVAARPCRIMTVDVARGGTASVHILLNGLSKGRTIRLSILRHGKTVHRGKWFRLIDVPVEVNTNPLCFIEKEGERNQFVIRRAPFRVYDAMQPIGGTIDTTAPTQAFRLHLPIFPNEKPGRREYILRVEHAGECQNISLIVNVRKAVIPPVGKDSFPYTNWFSFNLMAERHGLSPWSEAHWKMIRRYADLMLHARQNVFWVPLSDIFTKQKQGFVLNRQRLRRIVRTFTGAGMYFIVGGHVAQRTGSEWTAATFDIGLTGTRATSAEGNADLALIARQLMREIERNGWQKRWIQHVTDEPIPANAADYRILTGMVRRYMPGLPILDATMDTTLAGSVDIWCPQVQEYQKHRKAFDAQRALGDRVWFYTCCAPGGPWLNRLLDMELLRPALFGWASALFRLDGFLHWALNHYRPGQDPFQQSVVKHSATNSLPAGDTHIVYPGAGGPWSSVRLEAQREGFEDLELLRRLDKKTANRIIRKAIRGFDDYTKNVKSFRTTRKAMFNAMDDVLSK